MNKTDIYSVTSRRNSDGRRVDVNGNFHSLKGIETGDMLKPEEVYEIERYHREILTGDVRHKIKRLTTKITISK